MSNLEDHESKDKKYKRKLNKFKKTYCKKRKGITLYDYAIRLAEEKYGYFKLCSCARCIVAGVAVSKQEYFFKVLNDLFNDELFKTKRIIPDSYYNKPQ